MAFRESDPGPAELGNFFSFKAIGDKFAGLYQSHSYKTNKFNKEQLEIVFKSQKGTEKISANFDLTRRFEKALKDGLKPGSKVLIDYVSDLPNEDPNRSPMKQFKFRWDDSTVSAPASPAADPFAGL